jgi:CHAT domain-containing protein
VLLSYQVTDQGVISYLVREGKIVSSDWVEMERKQLEELVKEYRSSFESVEYVSDLKKHDSKLSLRLYELFVAKHLSQVKKQEKLIIVPDGVLALLPIEALVMEENPLSYVGDSYDIVYAHSGTSLTLARTLQKDRKAALKHLLVLADPVFSVTDARIAGKVQVAKKDESQADKEKAIVKASMGAGKGEVFPRLSVTVQGAERLGALFKGSVDSLTGLDARKEVFMQKPLDQYKYLALLTHGILDNELPYVKEPALVFTQVNTEDGFLTMTEVMGLKLNCEVAALTACRTGIGRRVSGEGVMHMGRGFQYAGAKSVLMSLWNVAEDSTTYMVERFFTYLKDGQAPSIAPFILMGN